MKSEVQSLSPLKRRLDVEIPEEAVATALEKMYRDVQKVAKFKGFRPGKAPMAMIKSNYKGQVESDVVRDLIMRHYEEALNKHDLDPLGLPKIEFDGFKEGEVLKFSATFEIRPQIELKKYTGFTLEKTPATVKPEQVESYLNSLREQHAKVVPLIEVRPAQKSDIAVIDFVGTVNGAQWEGSTGENYMLEIGSTQIIPEIDAELPGMNVGDLKKITVTLPSDYKPENVAGHVADFSVTLKELKKKVLPDLDDDFAKTLGEFDTLAALKESVEKEMAASMEQESKKELRNQVIKKIVESNPFDVPQTMVDEQRQALVSDVQHRMTHEGMNPEQFEEYKKKWEKDFNEHSEYLVRSGLLMNAIAKKENLIATDEDVSAKIKDYAEKTGIEEAKLMGFYGDPKNRNRLKYDITEDNTLTFVLNSCTITEKAKGK